LGELVEKEESGDKSEDEKKSVVNEVDKLSLNIWENLGKQIELLQRNAKKQRERENLAKIRKIEAI